MDKVSYALGLGIARQLSGLGATEINVEDFAQALKDIFQAKSLKLVTKKVRVLSAHTSSRNKTWLHLR